MNIAVVTLGWYAITQRPHHWGNSAVRCGHEVDIYTLGRPLRNYFRSSTTQNSELHVVAMSKSLVEIVLFQLRFTAAGKRHLLKRFGAFVNRRLFRNPLKKYDVIIIASEPFALPFQPSPAKIVYDSMDDWEFFPGVEENVLEAERMLVNNADSVLVVSQALYEKCANRYGAAKLTLIPNGCDYNHFSSVPRHKYNESRTVIGYTGNITEWFDWDSVLNLAITMPNALIRLVGPYRDVPTNLPNNIELLGRQPYDKMPGYNSTCDVCIIPFKGNDDLVRSVSPIKLYEYLASGCPVVSTPMDDVYRLLEEGVVHVASSPSDFVIEVLRAVALSWDDALVTRRRSVAQKHSWDSRWKAIEEGLGIINRGASNGDK
jgi:glycosyltransferase involved in cell wall biosynthesis